VIAPGGMIQYRGSAFAGQPGDFILAGWRSPRSCASASRAIVRARSGGSGSAHAGEIEEGPTGLLCALRDGNGAARSSLSRGDRQPYHWRRSDRIALTPSRRSRFADATGLAAAGDAIGDGVAVGADPEASAATAGFSAGAATVAPGGAAGAATGAGGTPAGEGGVSGTPSG
jgi:hypothetical protein